MINKKKNEIVLVLLLLIGSFLIIRNNYEEKTLLNSRKTTGVLIKKKDGKAVHGTACGTFEYYVAGKKYKFTEGGNYSFINIGDTVLIKYAKKNKSIATVIDKYYMKKYKYLK